MTPQILIQAYSQGYFPWPYENEPISWHCPDPRFILLFKNFHISHSLEKIIKKNIYTIRFDTCFEKVIKACAQSHRPGQNGTWIRDDIIPAYIQLHEMGLAHSVEAFLENKLVGGLYGVSLGGMFCGESMFSWKANSSKVAFVKLVEQLRLWDFDFIDCQVYSRYLDSFGAMFWSQEIFLKNLALSLKKQTRQGSWTT